MEEKSTLITMPNVTTCYRFEMVAEKGKNGQLGQPQEPRLYKKRWFMLFLYVAVCLTSTMQWTQFTIIADVVVDYYGVTYEAVNWTNMVAMVCYVLFVFPCSYVLDKYGIRVGILIAIFGTCAAAWIKMASASPDRFWMVILGQTVLTAPQAMILNMPPKLAANWFGPTEVSLACSIGLTGLNIGSAIGFFLPPLLVKKETAEQDLFVTGIGLAVICTVGFLLLLIFFTDKPPVPPSYAAINQDSQVRYIYSIKQLLKNVPLLFSITAGGLNIVTFCIFQALLNQIILTYYPLASEDAGWIGLLMTVIGLFGSVITGAILDFFKIYKLLISTIDLLIIFTTLAFGATLSISIIYPYVFCSILGFLILAKWSAAYQLALEASYPEPEVIVIGLINCIGQSVGIGVIYLYSLIFYEYNGMWANVFLALINCVSFLLIAFTKFELKRHSVNINAVKT